MPRTLFTADSHFGHKSVLSPRFDNQRPFASIEEHDEALVAAWNAAVRPDDIVWHLGDFAHKCSPDYAAGILSRLKGRKYLVRGNHDDGLGERLAWAGPVVDVATVQVQDPGMADPRHVWVSHYGHRVWPRMHRDHLHFYGHSHGSLEAIPGSLDVGVDCWNWRPVTLDQILARLVRFPARTDAASTPVAPAGVPNLGQGGSARRAPTDDRGPPGSRPGRPSGRRDRVGGSGAT